MKTTVDLDPELLKQAKRVALDRGCTLRELMTRGLRREMGESATPRPVKINWVFGPGPMDPELDLSNREAMHEWIRKGSAREF